MNSSCRCTAVLCVYAQWWAWFSISHFALCIGFTRVLRADQVSTICFTVEAILRIVALGSFARYFSSVWNAFDFCVIALGYLSYVNLGQQVSGVRALRGFRGLKPLRGMTVFKPLRCWSTVHQCSCTLCHDVTAFLYSQAI